MLKADANDENLGLNLWDSDTALTRVTIHRSDLLEGFPTLVPHPVVKVSPYLFVKTENLFLFLF